MITMCANSEYELHNDKNLNVEDDLINIEIIGDNFADKVKDINSNNDLYNNIKLIKNTKLF